MDLSRRSLICGLGAIFLGLVPDSAIGTGVVKVLSNGKVEVSIAKNPSLKKMGGVIQFKNKNGTDIALIRTANSSSGFRAINLRCTHQGVTVEQTSSGWICALGHQAEYAFNGELTKGPATSDLRSIPIKVTKTKVTVG